MSTSSLVVVNRRAGLVARVVDYVELTKPKIAVLVLITVAVSAFVGAWGQPDPWLLLHALVGTALVAASASALNQWLEADRDLLMQRTANRPLCAGRLQVAEVLLFSAVTIVVGAACLWAMVGSVAACWGLATWVMYVWVYTPLKVISPLNTLVGAIAGALPVFIGWSAAGGGFDARCAALFLLVFLWQFPHFMAIAWIYRSQYAQAGMRMLPVVDATGVRAGAQAVMAAAALLPISLLPVIYTPGALWYVAAVMLLGLAQLWCAVAFCVHRNEVAARALLRASLVYLPALLVLLVLVQVL
jgi:protoheme IX farnesyltransferase